jgi:phage shock protein B
MTSMSGAFISVFAIAMVFGIPLALIVGVVVIVVVAITRSGSGARGGKLREQEARMLQSMHASLSGMEQRLEALETLMLDRKP